MDIDSTSNIKEFDMTLKRTSAEWQKIHSDTTVLDPDGWDRKNFDYSWGEELITQSEYFARVMKSTCRWSNQTFVTKTERVGSSWNPN